MVRKKAVRFDEFIERVRHRLSPPPPNKMGGAVTIPARFEEAERAALASVEVLGECLCGEEALALARRLPAELGGPLTVHSADAKHYSLDQFYRHVAGKEGASVETARMHASAALEVVAEAAGEESLRYFRPLLPEGLLEPVAGV